MVNEQYKLWCERATIDGDLIAELKSIEGNEEAISDAFYKDLEFGTGGLRGVIGAGTNRMNVYTVGKATQGLADYVNSVLKPVRLQSLTIAVLNLTFLLVMRRLFLRQTE